MFYIDVQTNCICGSLFYLHSDGWALQRHSTSSPPTPCWAPVMLPLCMRKRQLCLPLQGFHFFGILCEEECLSGWSTKWVSYDTALASPQHNPQPITHNPQLTTSRWATNTQPSSCSACYLHSNSRHSPGSWLHRSLWVQGRHAALGYCLT